jgi:DNA-directed RNA polymerase specialized sigma24 family protein
VVTVPRTAGPGAASDVDRRLARDTVAGDQEAFTHLFHSYRQDVYRVARGVVGSHEVALDVVQETFFKGGCTADGRRSRMTRAR